MYEVVYLYRCILSGTSLAFGGGGSHVVPPRPQHKSLKATARHVLGVSILQLPKLAEQSGSVLSTAYQSIGALLVLGGDVACPIGVGSRVQLPENTLGVVTAFIEGTSHADILVDGASAASTWSISDISVLPSVPCPPAHVVLGLLDVETGQESKFAILDAFAHALPLLAKDASEKSPDYVRSILVSRTLSVLLSMAQRSSFALSKCASHEVLGRTIEVWSLVRVTMLRTINYVFCVQGLLHSKIDLSTLSDVSGAEMECLRAAFLRRRAMMTDAGVALLKDEPVAPSPVASVAIPSCIDVDYGRDAALMNGSHTAALVVSHQGAFIRADAPILLALPDYYFEVCALSKPLHIVALLCVSFALTSTGDCERLAS
jgi:hypothetical protein